MSTDNEVKPVRTPLSETEIEAFHAQQRALTELEGDQPTDDETPVDDETPDSVDTEATAEAEASTEPVDTEAEDGDNEGGDDEAA